MRLDLYFYSCAAIGFFVSFLLFFFFHRIPFSFNSVLLPLFFLFLFSFISFHFFFVILIFSSSVSHFSFLFYTSLSFFDQHSCSFPLSLCIHKFLCFPLLFSFLSRLPFISLFFFIYSFRRLAITEMCVFLLFFFYSFFCVSLISLLFIRSLFFLFSSFVFHSFLFFMFYLLFYFHSSFLSLFALPYFSLSLSLSLSLSHSLSLSSCLYLAPGSN
ncbi:unnamed protein product [Acanthosepion pharaonis]|uniref:Uncharacterized protein n=1 Tax=Acanthosepion pharaonis TaxID=158019 RepID=A0A812E3V3_ACAPH|nr:unnamed protein product [Sepia pharaonis]